MPSVAQQDYIVIAPKVGNSIDVDAYALGQLAKIIEKGDTSIFDVIVNHEGYNLSKIISVYYVNVNHYFVATVLTEDVFINTYDIKFTSTQYEGLAAIQESQPEYYGNDIPSLAINNDGYLFEELEANYITTPDGHKIAITLSTTGEIATVAISEETSRGGIKVPFEDIQKLIGLAVNQPE